MKPLPIVHAKWLGTCAALLAAAGCGGGYGNAAFGGSASSSASSGSGTSSGTGTNAPTVTVTVSPGTITVGDSAQLMWSSSNGGCVASGAWNGSQSASGSLMVTPMAAGSYTYGMTCGGGIYGSASASAVLTVSAPGTVVEPPPPMITPMMVAPAASSTGSDPASVVQNGSSTDFVISSAGKSAAATLIAGDDTGVISGWSPAVDALHFVAVHGDDTGAVYKGLAIATNAGRSLLYAADFRNRRIDVFDSGFVRQNASSTQFSFSDPAIPSNYAPFAIQAIGDGAVGATQLYVTYVRQPVAGYPPVMAAGQSFVDIFDTSGALVKRLVGAAM
jgi:uncharacterized protein (TIGR03118 family)